MIRNSQGMLHILFDASFVAATKLEDLKRKREKRRNKSRFLIYRKGRVFYHNEKHTGKQSCQTHKDRHQTERQLQTSAHSVSMYLFLEISNSSKRSSSPGLFLKPRRGTPVKSDSIRLDTHPSSPYRRTIPSTVGDLFVVYQAPGLFN